MTDSMEFDPATLNLATARARHGELAGSVIRTPLTRLASPAVAQALESAEVYLKLECYQHTGTFKARGALSVARAIPEADRAKGVTAASAGNHAIAAAWAARQLGMGAKVVMQSTANPFRVALARGEGAETRALQLFPRDFPKLVVLGHDHVDHADVTRRQHRDLLPNTQLLERAGGLAVMVGVARQPGEPVVGEPGVRVPGIARVHPGAAAFESPVLEVVDGLEQPRREEGLQQECNETGETRHPPDAEGHPPTDDQALQDAVVPQSALAGLGESSVFELPGTPKLGRNGAAIEVSIGLTEARRGGVVGAPDSNVMAAQVFGEEMLLEDGAEHEASEQSLPGLASVDQLVSRDDREAGTTPDGSHQHHHVDGEDVLQREQACDSEHDRELQRSQ